MPKITSTRWDHPEVAIAVAVGATIARTHLSMVSPREYVSSANASANVYVPALPVLKRQTYRPNHSANAAMKDMRVWSHMRKRIRLQLSREAVSKLSTTGGGLMMNGLPYSL